MIACRPNQHRLWPLKIGKTKKQKNNKRRKQQSYVGLPRRTMSPKGHTELIIGVSRAKQRQESFAEVQKSVTPQKKPKKTSYVARKIEFSFFGFFFERQASYGAETLTTNRSRAPRHFVLCMLRASAAKKI